MDKRRKPLTPHEQLLLRQKMEALVTSNQSLSVPGLLKEIRKTLRLTLPEMASVGRISTPALKNIEASRNSPSLATVEALLRPLGLKLAIVRARLPELDAENEGIEPGAASLSRTHS